MPALEIIISAIDRTKKAFRNIQSSVNNLERSARRGASRTNKAFSGIAGAIQAAGGGIQGAIGGVENALGSLGPAGMAAGAAVGAFGLAVADAVNVTRQFQQAVTNAATVTGKTGKELKKAKENISAVAQELGKTTVFSAREAANALYLVASAGEDVSKITTEELTPALNLAAGMSTDLTTTMDTLISTANQFGLQFKDIRRISDIITAAWGNSQASLEKFRYSMKYVGPIAHSLGYSIEETTANLMGLYNAGLTGEEAGTRLRGAFTRLLKPTEDAEQVLLDLGVSIRDSAGNVRPFVDILDDLKKAGITTTQSVSLFGQVAGPAMMSLMDQGIDSIREFQKELENSGGLAERVAKEQLNTFQGQMKLFQSALEGAKIEVGTALLPALTQLLKIITTLITPLMEVGKVIWDALKWAFGPLVDTLKELIKIFKASSSGSSDFSAGLKLLSYILKGTLMGFRIFNSILLILVKILKPILIPLIKILVNVIDWFSSGLKETGATTSNTISIIEVFISKLSFLKDTFNSVKDTFITAINIILSSFTNFKDTALSLINPIVNIFTILLNKILEIPKKIANVISSFSDLKNAAESAISGISKAISKVTAPITKIVKPKKPAITPTPAVKPTITPAPPPTEKGILETISGGVSNVVDKASDVVGNVISGIGDVLGFQQGGIVPATGIYYLHKGERVLNAKETRKVEKSKAQPQVTKIINFNFDKIYLSEKYSLADLEKDMKRDYARGF